MQDCHVEAVAVFAAMSRVVISSLVESRILRSAHVSKIPKLGMPGLGVLLFSGSDILFDSKMVLCVGIATSSDCKVQCSHRVLACWVVGWINVR